MDIKDYTDSNGKCSDGCGKCCTPVLPISLYEKNKIQKYLNRHPLVPNPNLDACPFLSDQKRCMIYIHRPEICQKYMCNTRLIDFYHFDKEIIDLRQAFFPNEPHTDSQELEQIKMDYEVKKMKARKNS